jgi:hypothetical protein
MKEHAVTRWIRRGGLALAGISLLLSSGCMTVPFGDFMAGISLLLSSGCMTVPFGDFTVLSNKTVRISDIDLGKAEKEHVVGEDVSQVFLIPWGSMPPTVFGALDDAFKQADGDVMVDATVKIKSEFYLFYARNKVIVEGDVIKTRKN